MVKKKEDAFLIDLISFYKKTLGNAADSVKILQGIQIKFPQQYKDLIDLQEDPSVLIELSKKMNPEASKILIEIMVNASTLSNRLNKLFELKVEQKKKLIKDFQIFSKSLERNLKLLKKVDKNV